MESNQLGRVWVIVAALGAATLLVSGRLAWLQLIQADNMATEAQSLLTLEERVQPDRGYIYDRNGSVLAAPGNDFQLGADLPFLRFPDGNRWLYDEEGEPRQHVSDAIALDLAPILQVPYEDLLASLSAEAVYTHLNSRISAETVEQIRALEYQGLAFTPIPRRLYPQGDLMCHILGYVDYDGHGLAGVEAWWDADLAGEAAWREFENVPSTPREDLRAREGVDLILTVDRNVQAAVERHLFEALETYDADNGEIIVMNPRSGEIIAMAATPCYDPYTYFTIPEEDRNVLLNPSISEQYEPGSVMKLVTMAIGIDSGTVTAGTTYQDSGLIVSGGISIRNAEQKSYGPVDMTGVLINSINTATAWISTRTGAEKYYNYMDRFGFGHPTGVDIALEISGYVPEPGSQAWTEATLATNGFGQGIGTTPLQMLSAVSAIANDGRQMQPHVVKEVRKGGEVVETIEPREISTPISRETARIIKTMAIQVVSYLDVPGYTVAGKTGTAQIPVIPPDGGAPFYHPTNTIASFVGWLPADEPELAVLVKLDVPKVSQWGSETAAPTFEKLAKELVILLDIPPDSVRFSSR